MYIIQLIEVGTNKVINTFEKNSEIQAMKLQVQLEKEYSQDTHYVERSCSDCGNEICSC
jgi:hypothetical protein